jgi:hypothetical protein
MGMFRGLNLLQAVEAQTTLGAALESTLSGSPAQEAEFGALLSTRHMARRMAGNAITMAAITLSDVAIKLVFENTTEYNFRPIEEIAKNQAAMIRTSTIANSLNAVVDNDTAWSYFSTSAYYASNVVNTLTTIIGLDPNDFASVSALLSDSSAMLDISLSARAMKALVASTPAMTYVTTHSAPMAFIAADSNAMEIVANSDSSVHLIAQSQIALDEVTEEARNIVIAVPSALFIISSYESAWDYILSTSGILATTIYPLLLAFGGLSSTTFTSVDDIFADTTASFAIANSKPAMMALLYEPTALGKLLNSDNLNTFIGSLVAMTEMATSESTMTTLITSPSKFSILLTSTTAKAAIIHSSTLFNTMMTSGSNSLATVQGLAEAATLGNDGTIGAFTSLGVSGNMILLTGVMNSAVATYTDNYFKGDDQSVVTVALPGTSASTGPVTMNMALTNGLWDINATVTTAAAQLKIQYVDFN